MGYHPFVTHSWQILINTGFSGKIVQKWNSFPAMGLISRGFGLWTFQESGRGKLLGS